MENVIFTQLSIPEIRQIFRQELETYFATYKQGNTTLPEEDQLLTVPQAAEFLHLSVPTIYSKISRGELPVMKRSKRCYFLKSALMDYLQAGRKLTLAEIKTEAAQFTIKTKRG